MVDFNTYNSRPNTPYSRSKYVFITNFENFSHNTQDFEILYLPKLGLPLVSGPRVGFHWAKRKIQVHSHSLA